MERPQGMEPTMAGMHEEHTTGGSLWHELLSFSLYKPNQGRIARQLTGATLFLTLLIGAWRLAELLPLWLTSGTALSPVVSATDLGVVRFLIPGLIVLAGGWLFFRLMNVPRVADFLIAVEAEMAKVSWPSLDEVIRSSVVIIFLIFALSAILAAYDLFWWFVLRAVQGFN